MKRLREMDVADSLMACVIVGPGDLRTWEVSACVDSDGMSLEVIGRASDLEAAAASAMAVLTQNGSSLGAPDGPSTTPAEGSAASWVTRPYEARDTGSRTTGLWSTNMHPPATRVIYRDQPYLLELNADRSLVAAFGPFTPGTEPSLAECSADTQVHDAELLDRLTRLLPISPDLPAAEDTLAGG